MLGADTLMAGRRVPAALGCRRHSHLTVRRRQVLWKPHITVSGALLLSCWALRPAAPLLRARRLARLLSPPVLGSALAALAAARCSCSFSLFAFRNPGPHRCRHGDRPLRPPARRAIVGAALRPFAPRRLLGAPGISFGLCGACSCWRRRPAIAAAGAPRRRRRCGAALICASAPIASHCFRITESRG